MKRNKTLIIEAIKSTIPVFFGYVPIGIIFGFLLTQSGISWFYAPLMCLMIYSGVTQFLAISFITGAVPLFDVAVTVLLVNLRHSFYGLSLFRKFKNTGWIKPYLIYSLTDETYALLTTMDEPDAKFKSKVYFLVAALNQSYWTFGSFVGAVAGKYFKISLKGLDFALTALFVVLVIEQYKKVKNIKPFIIALSVGVIGLVVLPKEYFLLGSIVAATFVLVVTAGKHKQKEFEEFKA